MAEANAILSQEEKTCSRCPLRLPPEAFPLDKRSGRRRRMCASCLGKSAKASAARHRAKPEAKAAHREASKRFRRKHPERVAALMAAWLIRHPGYERDRGRRRYANNPKRQYAANRSWLLRNRSWLKKWYRTPKGVICRANRSHLRRGAMGSFTAEDWVQLLDRYGGKCAYCQAEGKLTIDHKIPVSRGGRHEASNIVPACPSCNSSKGARTPEEWKSRGEGTLCG